MTARIYISCLCCIISIAAAAQKQPAGEVMMPDYEQITVSQYAGKQWDSLLITGNMALQAGYDYPYMRIRTGEAAFWLGRYAQAAGHLRRSLQHNNSVYATELLFFSLLNGGRYQQAARLTAQYKSPRLSALRRQYLRPVLYAEGGPLYSRRMRQQIPPTSDTTVYSDVLTEQQATYFGAGATIYAGSRLSFGAALSLLNYQKHRETRIAFLDTLSGNFGVRQLSAYVSASLALPLNLTLSPALHYAGVRVGEPVTTTDTLVQKYLGKSLAGNTTDYAAGAEITYAGAYSRLTAGAWRLHYANSYATQFTATITLLPRGNLNLYTTTGITCKAGTQKRPVVVSWLVGGQVLPGIWTETMVTAGNLTGTAEHNALLLHNQVTGTRYRLSAMLLAVITPQLRLLGRYQYTLAEAGAAFMGPSYTIETRTFTYHKHLITFGITCTIPAT